MNVYTHKLLSALRHMLTVRLHFRRWYIVVSHYAGDDGRHLHAYQADAYDVRGWLCAGGGDTRSEAVGWADRLAR